MPTVTTADGVRVVVHDLGAGRRDLLLDHATGFHGRVWGPLAAHLEQRYRCISFDHRAHGDSGRPPPDGFVWERLAQDTGAVVAERDLYGSVAIGHSMGATSLLLTEAANPGTFAALVLYEPIVMPPDHPVGENPLVEVTLRRRADFASYDEAVANYASKPPLNKLRADALDAYVRHGLLPTAAGTVTLKCRPEDEARVYEGSATSGAWEALASVSCPVLVLHGREDDEGGPTFMAVAVADELRDGELQTFDDLGHFGPLEAPARVGEVAARFFTRTVPAS